MHCKASFLGILQNVFAYTFYGAADSGRSQRKYFEGIGLNAANTAKIFPDWTLRVYHNVTGNEGQKTLCQLACKHNNLDFCDITRNPMIGDMSSVLPTMWRFTPLADKQVRMNAILAC